MPIVQAAPPASEDGQLLVCEKGPVTFMPEMASAALPLFVSVMVCAALVVPTGCGAKLRVAGDKETDGGVSPNPLRDTVNPFFVTPSEPATVRVPAREPLAVGVNVTLYMHELPPGTPAAAQLFACEKSPVI